VSNTRKTVKQGWQDPTQLVASTHPSSTCPRRNLHDGATCTTRCRTSAGLEARLENPSPTFFHTKQAARSRRMSYVVASFHRFWGTTDKPKPAWFWGTNQETVTVILRHKSLNHNCRFWGQTGRNRRHRFWGQPGENHPRDCEAKPLTNRQPWFWGSTKKLVLLISTCTVQTAHGVTRPPDRPVTEYLTCATIPSPYVFPLIECSIENIPLRTLLGLF
jgi:hypothetical protein